MRTITSVFTTESDPAAIVYLDAMKKAVKYKYVSVDLHGCASKNILLVDERGTITETLIYGV